MAQEIFAQVLKGHAASIGIVLTESTPRKLVAELTDKLPNDEAKVVAIKEVSSSFRAGSTAYKNSALWGDTFSQRAAAVLASITFGVVAHDGDWGQVSKKHHWLPLCYTRRFAHRNPARSRRNPDLVKFQPSTGLKLNLAQREVILPITKTPEGLQRGWNDLALEGFFGVIEAAFDRALREAIEDEERLFWLSFFGVIQNLRTFTTGQQPSSTVAGFVSKAVIALEADQHPTLHVLEEPASINATNFFREFRSDGEIAHVAPITPGLLLVLSTSHDDGFRHRAAKNFAGRQLAGAKLSGDLLVGAFV